MFASMINFNLYFYIHIKVCNIVYFINKVVYRKKEKISLAIGIQKNPPPKTILMLYPQGETFRQNRNARAWTQRGFAVIKVTEPDIAKSILGTNPEIEILIVDDDFGPLGGCEFLREIKRSGMVV